MSIQKVLIANRGEIAVRLIRCCRELGIPSVAVFSDADKDAPHTSVADEAVYIGPPPARESYLSIDKIIQAAITTGANAIHPGYGFLSENAEFAKACEDNNIIFVGPRSETIELLGDKIRAKECVSAAGVPIVPGYMGEDQSNDRLLAEATKIGVPLLVKAAAGGGGKGMRVVRSLDDFLPLLDEARREAESAFGDSRVLLEKYIINPRHIEVQIFGDAAGNVIHLFERECSIQRRHQKIIEESPSCALTDEMRSDITLAAVRAGKASGYVNAGTVEFIYEPMADGSGKFYFLEVNTRLQVEHPVTESITGLDLARLQFHIADGKELDIVQDHISSRGHSIEVRIYAENPETGFLPSIGELRCWVEPKGPAIRVDSGVRRGTMVSPYYDPMLAKLIVYAESRSSTIQKMISALKQFYVLGVETNIEYLLAILEHERFQAGEISTGFLSEYFERWKPVRECNDDLLIALACAHHSNAVPAKSNSCVQDFNVWGTATNWRNVSELVSKGDLNAN